MKKIVTIIIPVYNAEEYLTATLECVLNQTYENIEVLLINDGSTDLSGAICNEYAAYDSRFHVYHVKNGGVSKARNYGLDHMSGDYVMFIDSDDLVKAEYVERMIETVCNMDAQLAVCRFMDGSRYSCEDFTCYRTADEPRITKIDLNEYRWTGKYAHPEVCGGIFAADLIRDLRFRSDLHIGEDAVFFSYALKRAGSFYYIDEQFYYYRYNRNSAMNRTFQEKNITEILARECICDMFSDQSDSFKNECEAVLAMRCKANYCKAVNSHYPDVKLIDEIYYKAWKRRKTVFRSTGYGRKAKVLFIIFVYCPKAFIVLQNYWHALKKAVNQ